MPRLNSCDDMLDVVEKHESRRGHGRSQDGKRPTSACSSVRRTQSCGTLGGLVMPPSPPRANGKKFSRSRVRKVPSSARCASFPRAVLRARVSLI